jgi:hypothetical protein
LPACMYREVLKRYRIMVDANMAPVKATADSQALLEAAEAFQQSLTPAEVARIEYAADKEHTIMVLRLMRERRHRQELNTRLEAARAEQAALKV